MVQGKKHISEQVRILKYLNSRMAETEVQELHHELSSNTNRYTMRGSHNNRTLDGRVRVKTESNLFRLELRELWERVKHPVLYAKYCNICGNGFFTFYTFQEYCNKKCNYKAYKMNNRDIYRLRRRLHMREVRHPLPTLKANPITVEKPKVQKFRRSVNGKKRYRGGVINKPSERVLRLQEQHQAAQSKDYQALPNVDSKKS